MKIFNTYSNKLEELVPINKGRINMYVCGPTVNKRAHIGNIYPAVFFDTVKRYFEYLGYEVNYASNFTDVDDKIIKAAIEEKTTEKEIASKFENIYLNDLAFLNCKPVTYRPRVTEYIDDIIDFIDNLYKKGNAYKSDNSNNVYFNVDSIKDYGKLSNQNTDFLNHGTRISVDEDKRNPYDFALWKHTNEGIKWNSPFGEGRPGWHTECVVMINKLFREKIDIHGGGIDLVFPHHENEIAQSIAANNNTLANIWMHNGHIMFNGVKMSKSLGNILNLDDLKEEYNANTIRITLLKNHYRLPLNLSDSLLEESCIIDQKIKSAIKQCILYLTLNNLDINQKIKDEQFEKYMDDDFNLSNVFSHINSLIKNLNIGIRNNNEEEIKKNFYKLLTIIDVLGLKYNISKISNDNIYLYNKYIEYKNNKVFENSDAVRKELIERDIL